MFMKIISVGDVIGDSCKLGDSRVSFFAKTELFVWEKTLLRDVSNQSTGDDSFE